MTHCGRSFPPDPGCSPSPAVKGFATLNRYATTPLTAYLFSDQRPQQHPNTQPPLTPKPESKKPTPYKEGVGQQ
jgi:hypothetical protein